jgi:hypothetical protein
MSGYVKRGPQIGPFLGVFESKDGFSIFRSFYTGLSASTELNFCGKKDKIKTR